MHPYLMHGGPQVAPELLVPWLERLARRFRELSPGKEVPIYITETGWPRHDGPKGVDARTQADYLARTYLSVRTVPSVRGLWWYNFQDNSPDPKVMNDTFGLVTVNHAKKPAFEAFGQVAKYLRRTVSAERIKSSNAALWLVRLDLEDGSEAYAIWSSSGRPLTLEVTLTVASNGQMTIERVGGLPTGRNEMPLAAGDTRLPVTADATPTVISSTARFIGPPRILVQP
jgi:polysaccharide biosynthesis protein PslG